MVPFHSSVSFLLGIPPKINVEVELCLEPAIVLLAVLQLLTSVQLVPFHNSVLETSDEPLYPATFIAADCVPDPT